MDAQQEFRELLLVLKEMQGALRVPDDVLAGKAMLSVEDMEALLTKTQSFLTKIQEAGTRLANKMNMSPQEMQRYLSDPKNFSKEDWQLLQELQQQSATFEKSLNAALSKDEDLVEKERKKQNQLRLSGKRNWIPM